MADFGVAIGALRLRAPVLAAAGTFGYGIEFAKIVDISKLGAIVTKTVTTHPRVGNPPPRLVETPSGMLNAVGLQNVGIDAFISEKLPALRTLPAPVIVSVLGDSEAEAAALAGRLDAAEGVAAIELNLSCPNDKRKTAGTGFACPSIVAQDPEATFAMVAAARRTTRKPLIVKLSPEVTDLTPVAQAAERAGADALTLVNTFVGMSLDPVTRRSRLGAVTGGTSGPAIRPLALYRVWYTAQAVRIPVIGLGGIVRAEDALEYFLAGAAAVAVGTATFANPRAAVGIARGIERFFEKHGIGSLGEYRGTLRTDAAPRPQ